MRVPRNSGLPPLVAPLFRLFRGPLQGACIAISIGIASPSLFILVAAELKSLDPQSAAPLNEGDITPAMPVWNPLYSLSTSVGYKDNLILASRGAESSGFVGLSGDFTLWKRPNNDGKELQFGLSASDRRYWADRNMDHENAFIGYGRYLHDLGSRWQWVSEFSTGYFDQVFDFTTLETQAKRRRLQQITLGGSMGFRRRIHDRSWLQFSPIASRSWFHDEFDHYTEYGGAVTWTTEYGNRSEWSIDYSARIRDYDSSMQATLQGFSVPGSSLRYERHALQVTDKHYIDPARHWLLETKVRGLLSYDNGSGYFDYWRVGFSERLQIRLRRWEFRFEAGLTYYEFPHQFVGATLQNKRTRCDIIALARVERTLRPGWKLFAEYDRDQSQASDSLEQFRANTVSGGVVWEF